ncbi:MAG: hypothetical protein ACYCUD_13910, partial [Candidatus Dormibacteria bacterium]
MSDEVTAEARVADPGIFPLLWALGEEWSTAMREVYRRVVVRGEPWFTQGQGGVRSELIVLGRSQREATSMLVAARGAQDAAVEATKFSLERSREQLVETATQLAKAQRGTSKRAVGKRHGLASSRSRLICRCGKLEERLGSPGRAPGPSPTTTRATRNGGRCGRGRAPASGSARATSASQAGIRLPGSGSRVIGEPMLCACASRLSAIFGNSRAAPSRWRSASMASAQAGNATATRQAEGRASPECSNHRRARPRPGSDGNGTP